MIINRGDLKTEVRGNLTAIIQKDKWNVTIHPHMHSPSMKGNSWRKRGKDVKLAIVQDYYQTTGIRGLTWKWTKKLFFHLLDLTTVNSCNILDSYGSKLSHWQFRLTLVTDLPQEPGRMPRPQTTTQRRQPHPRANWEDLTHDTKDTGSSSVREFGAVCVPLKRKRTRTN